MKELKVTTKMNLLKLLFIIIILLSLYFWGAKQYAIGITILVLSYLMDFAFRNCPHCGEHVPIQVNVKKDYRCTRCGEKFNVK